MTTAAIEKNNAAIQQPQQTQVSSVTPPVDVYENENDLVFIADMPGVPKGGLDVQIENMELTMVGKVNDAFEYRRSFKLPNTIDVDKVNASLKSGVLNITFKKAEAAKPKKIKVKLAK
ncbi:MAG: Hsp20/alpha crystallin family protein [Deltaproteobacteria bacterium]|nr:Hsp20/alpha crystallin family protein [Deltaproteobacteria bacterium]MBN2674489.1 Hsp20/alpha crystallin family protein [Deltaproteobacteria bacterium]